MPQGTAHQMDTDLFAAFVAKVVERLPRDLDPDVTQGWINNPASLQRILREALSPPAPSNTEYARTADIYSVTVDYTIPLADMVAAGKYDWVNSEITAEHFPTKGEGRVEVKISLACFNRVMESNEVITELDKLGLRPATLPELLAFGAKYPDVQRGFPVVALGSVWRDADGSRGVPCLSGDGSERLLSLDWFGDRWGGRYRFAAVSK